MRKYTVKELEKIINLSHTAIRDQIKQGKLNTVDEIINRRTTQVICLSEDEFNDLIKIYGLRNINQVEENFNQVEEDFINVESGCGKQPKNNITSEELAFKVIALSESFNSTLVNLNQQNESVYKELLSVSSKTMLLEDSENRTKTAYIELQAEQKQTLEKLKEVEINFAKLETDYKHLEAENKQLKEKKPFFSFIKQK